MRLIESHICTYEMKNVIERKTISEFNFDTGSKTMCYVNFSLS